MSQAKDVAFSLKRVRRIAVLALLLNVTALRTALQILHSAFYSLTQPNQVWESE